MNRSSTAREALIAELIGDVAELINRVEALTKTMEKAQEEMTNAAWLLDSRVEPFRHYLAAEIEQTKDIAVKAYIRQTNEVALLEQRKQREAMGQSARDLIDAVIRRPLHDFARELQDLVAKAKKPRELWWAVGATAYASAVCSGGFVYLYFVGR